MKYQETKAQSKKQLAALIKSEQLAHVVGGYKHEAAKGAVNNMR